MTTTPAADASRYRLPTDVLPTRYDLVLAPDLEAATFTGTADIAITAAVATATIVLNAIELDIAAAIVTTAGGGDIEATVDYDAETERATLALASELPAGDHLLRLTFAGILNDKLRGFYRSTFTDVAGNERIIATTQFESTNARRAFPCWDEPAIKAVFGVTMIVPEDQFAVSCGGETGRAATDDGKVRITFADTMMMSTYLVAFIVGPLEATDPVDVNGTPLRIVHPVGTGHLTAFALEAGAFALDYFETYFGVKYPGDKLDMIAVPDFAFGAMENLGCITFREALLLTDPETGTQPELLRITDVIAHEIAHMWFGDLVTMEWWNGLWLKEAFATFMEMKATDAFRPEWERWVDFGLSRTAAYDVDSLAATRPVEFPVVSPADAEGMYDILTYEKGAALVRMLEQYLGEEEFRGGIAAYLDAHAYGTTETSDLWDAIEGATGQPTRQIMDTWIYQGGYPLITASLGNEGSTLDLTQTMFRYSPTTDAGTWAVPLIIAVGQGGDRREHRVLLDGTNATVDLGDGADWVLVNAGGHGFYRVAYSDDLLGRLTVRAQDQLSAIERYNLVDDAVSATLAGASATPTLLEFLTTFGDEDDPAVWRRISGALAMLGQLLDGDELERFEGKVRDLARPALDIAGWGAAADESDRAKELRAGLFGLLGTTGNDTEVQERAAAMHDAHLKDPSGTDPAMISAAVAMLAKVGGDSTFSTFLTQSNTAPTPQEQRRYLYALAEFEDDAQIDEVLTRASDGRIRTQDAPYVIGRALHNRDQGPRVWAFVKSNWDQLNDLFPSNSIVRMAEGVRALSTPALKADVDDFFATHTVPQGDKTLAQHLERLAVNVAFAERETSVLRSAI